MLWSGDLPHTNWFCLVFMNKLTASILGFFLAVTQQAFSQGTHEHINVGATNSTPGSPLFFTNGPRIDTNSLLVFCFASNDPLYPGLFQNPVTFTASPATVWTGGPARNAAALGSFIELEFVSLTGPAGGILGFYQEDEEATSTSKIFEIATGTTNGTNRIVVSEGFVDPDSDKMDPYGHVHGRRLSLNKEGLYIAAFRAVETSTNGVGGGPIHQPSELLRIYLHAGERIESITRYTNEFRIQFVSPAFKTTILEYSDQLSNPGVWTNLFVHDSSNHSDLHSVADTSPLVSQRFYRLRFETP